MCLKLSAGRWPGTIRCIHSWKRAAAAPVEVRARVHARAGAGRLHLGLVAAAEVAPVLRHAGEVVLDVGRRHHVQPHEAEVLRHRGHPLRIRLVAAAALLHRSRGQTDVASSSTFSRCDLAKIVKMLFGWSDEIGCLSFAGRLPSMIAGCARSVES